MIEQDLAELLITKIFYWSKVNKLNLSQNQLDELYQIVLDMCSLVIKARESINK